MGASWIHLAADAGIVDRHIKSTVGLDREANHCLDRGRVRYIRVAGDRISDLLGDPFRAPNVEVGHDDPSASLCQVFGTCLADARSTPGDESDLPTELTSARHDGLHSSDISTESRHQRCAGIQSCSSEAWPRCVCASRMATVCDIVVRHRTRGSVRQRGHQGEHRDDRDRQAASNARGEQARLEWDRLTEERGNTRLQCLIAASGDHWARHFRLKQVEKSSGKIAGLALRLDRGMISGQLLFDQVVTVQGSDQGHEEQRADQQSSYGDLHGITLTQMLPLMQKEAFQLTPR